MDVHLTGGTHGNWIRRGWSKSLETVIRKKVCKYLGNKLVLIIGVINKHGWVH